MSISDTHIKLNHIGQSERIQHHNTVILSIVHSIEYGVLTLDTLGQRVYEPDTRYRYRHGDWG